MGVNIRRKVVRTVGISVVVVVLAAAAAAVEALPVKGAAFRVYVVQVQDLLVQVNPLWGGSDRMLFVIRGTWCVGRGIRGGEGPEQG
jgi:hypothetical protein